MFVRCHWKYMILRAALQEIRVFSGSSQTGGNKAGKPYLNRVDVRKAKTHPERCRLQPGRCVGAVMAHGRPRSDNLQSLDVLVHLTSDVFSIHAFLVDRTY